MSCLKRMMMAAAGAGGLVTKGVYFDGLDQDNSLKYVGTLTGLNDSKEGTCSFWFRLDGKNYQTCIPLGIGTNLNAHGMRFRRTDGNKFQMIGAKSDASNVLVYESSITYTSNTAWRHFVTSYNLATSTIHLYIDGVDRKGAVATNINDTIDYVPSIGGHQAKISGAPPEGGADWHGGLAEIFFNDTYIDLSSSTNREKFRTAAGKPEDLGDDGSTPLGVQPVIYCSVRDGEAATDFATNRGTGQNFTATGPQVLTSTHPSD